VKTPGCFISFEGIEGSGKSTQVDLLAQSLIAKFLLKTSLPRPVVQTREPGGTPLGDQIRTLLFSETPIAPAAELFLFLSARAQHVKETIRPALQAGKIVLCDRFTDATLAYQIAGRGLPMAALESALLLAADGLTPDLTFLLDLDVEIAQARLRGRSEINRIDLERLTFHERVRQGYLALAKQHPDRIRIVKADADPGTIHDQIRKISETFLNKRSG
jgi:dTMP kinase